MAPVLIGALRRGARLAGMAAMALSVLALLVLGLGPHTGRYRTATVLSGSMRPAITEGSVVLVTPLPATELRQGHVIMYRIPTQDRRVVAHRVVEVVEGGERPVVRTQGDANPQPDAWTARLEGETLWQVRGALPNLGFALQALRSPLVRTLSVGVVPVVLALLWLAEIWRSAGTGAQPEPGVPSAAVGS
ncbi:MAG: signal peptidase I [Actinobacteria bacterium]|nr:signal peptidase I [Actinomycetota bacterium]